MVSGAVDEGHDSGEGPGELVATVSLRAGEGLVAEPEDDGKHVGFDQDEGESGRELNK